MRGFRSDAPDRRVVRWWRGGSLVRDDVHTDAKPLEDRRRARRVAAAWLMRRMGRDSRRDIWPQGVWRQRRRELHVATVRHVARCGDRFCWRLGGVWRTEKASRHTLEC